MVEKLMAMECKTQRTLNGPKEDIEAVDGVSAAVRQAKGVLEIPNPVTSRTALVTNEAGPEQRGNGGERETPLVCT